MTRTTDTDKARGYAKRWLAALCMLFAAGAMVLGGCSKSYFVGYRSGWGYGGSYKPYFGHYHGGHHGHHGHHGRHGGHHGGHAGGHHGGHKGHHGNHGHRGNRGHGRR